MLLTGDRGSWAVPDVWKGAASLLMKLSGDLLPKCLAGTDMETRVESNTKLFIMQENVWFGGLHAKDNPTDSFNPKNDPML